MHDIFFQRRRAFRGVNLYHYLAWPSFFSAKLAALNPVEMNKAAPIRVLAAITGGWALREYATPERYALLHDQLSRYAAACEAGYDVTVALIAYEGWRANEHVDASRYFCARIGATLPITVHLFPFQPLPPKAFGAAGTLAFQHRRLFLRFADAFDLFLVQEDDVAVLPGHFDYFLQWADFFRGTDFYPGVVFYELAPFLQNASGEDSGLGEVSARHVFLDFRLNDAYLLRHKSEPLLSMWSSSCCAYMLSASQLKRAIAKDSWLGDLQTREGEFNPYFGSARWLHADYRVVVPAQDLRRAMLWHSPNKYVRAHWEQERAGGVSGGQAFLTRQTMAEAFAVLGLCCNGSLADGAAKDVRIRAVGDDCGKCAEAVLLKVEKERLVLEELYVAFECVREVDVLFPPVERM